MFPNTRSRPTSVLYAMKNHRVLDKKCILSLWWGAESVTTKVSKLSNARTCVYIGG